MLSRLFASNFERTERLSTKLAALRAKKEYIQGELEQLKHDHQLLKDKHVATKRRLELYVSRLETDNRRLNQQLIEVRFERASPELQQDQFDINLLNQPAPLCLVSADHSGLAGSADQPVQSTMLGPPVRAKGKRPCNAWNTKNWQMQNAKACRSSSSIAAICTKPEAKKRNLKMHSTIKQNGNGFGFFLKKKPFDNPRV